MRRPPPDWTKIDAEYEEIWNQVNQHFKDEEKTELWMQTVNPLLGHMSPSALIRFDRTEKLRRFIENAKGLKD